MATNKDVNRIAVEELRRSYDAVSKAVDQLRIRTLTFIAATFALLTYLYSSGDLFVPAELYGKIFYFIGLGSILVALAIFLLGLRPHAWELSTEIKELRNIRQKDENEYLEYVKGEYISSFTNNARTYESKQGFFNVGFILLIVGAFTLVIIKTFPKEVQPCYNTTSTACKSVLAKEGITND